MSVRIILAASLGLGLVGPAWAGPCTQRLADLEKSVTAKQEGGGPALASPGPGGSTSATSPSQQAQQPPVPVAAGAAGGNNAMQLIQEAKELDRQGKEADCMALVTKIEPAIPPTK